MAKAGSKSSSSKKRPKKHTIAPQPVAETLPTDPGLPEPTQNELQPSQTIPKLKIRPRAPTKQASPSPPSPQQSESPQITPPPPLESAELKKRTTAALAALLGPSKGNSVRANKAYSTPGADSSSEDLDGRSVTPQKRKRAESEASEPLTVPGIETLTEEESKGIDELDEDEISADPDSEELNEPIFIRKYPFLVPVDGANTTVHISTQFTFKQLMSELADTLSVAPKDVKIAYRFSIEPCSAPWSHLKNDNNLSDLFKKAMVATEKQRKQKSTRAFFVELKDLAPGQGTGGQEKSKGKNKSKKDKGGSSGKKKKSRHDSDSDDSDNDLDPAHIAKKKSASQWIAQIQKDNACEEHPNEACLKYATHHHQLSKNEMGAWALFLTHDYTSTTQPPRQLKIGDRKPDSKKPASTKSGPGGQETPQPNVHGSQTLPSMLSPAIAPPLYPNYGYNPFFYHPPVVPPPNFPPPHASSSSHHHGHYYGSGYPYQDNIPSSDPPEEVKDVTLFPRISEWLSQLDAGSRGVDGHNFTKFSGFFDRLKYIRICDIADNLTAKTLLAKCDYIAEGTAQKIISYAKQDTQTIRRKEERKQKARRNRH